MLQQVRGRASSPAIMTLLGPAPLPAAGGEGKREGKGVRSVHKSFVWGTCKDQIRTSNPLGAGVTSVVSHLTQGLGSELETFPRAACAVGH